MAIVTLKKFLGKVKDMLLSTGCIHFTPAMRSGLYLDSINKLVSDYYSNVEGNPEEIDLYKEDLSLRLKDYLTRYKDDIILLPGVISNIDFIINRIYTPEEITDILSVISSKDK